MNEPMTLIDRLRNPAWKSLGNGGDAILETMPSRKDMTEAADKIEQLQTALEKIRFMEGVSRSIEKIALDALTAPQRGTDAERI